MFDLDEWRACRLKADRAGRRPELGRDDVTVVSYVFGDRDKLPAYIDAIELALRETYRWCGMLKTTLVVNHMVEAIEKLKTEFGGILRIDVDASLTPGDIVGFSRNMIRTLPDRFDTPYMLNIHPDGFPLRNGLDEFVGEWDYIGGPWNTANDDWITRVLLSRNDGAGNGGFALRSRKICEIGASAYRRFWKIIPDCYLLYEDIFFTRFLTRWHPGYLRRISLAPRVDAMRFSICEELCPDEKPVRLPFGFHSWNAFKMISEVTHA